MNSHFIVCDNLVKVYKIENLEVVALLGLDLVVGPGEMVGVIGVSGSGKSTLMNILGGLDRPTAGRVWVDGQDLLKLSNRGLDHYRRQKVGFVWQQTSRNLLPYLSALGNVQLPMDLSGQLDSEARAYCRFLLETVGLGERMGHKLGELSGGQQQRVAIAVAIANRPKLLLADEPTGEVDSQTALDIYNTLRKLNRELGLTTLIVSHDRTIARHVDRVVAIRDGRLATETVRQKRASRSDENEELSPDEPFEELTVLDASGRLQIPLEYRQHFEMRGRVRLELAEDGILVKPAPESDYAEESERLVEQLEAVKAGRLQRLGRRALGSLRGGLAKAGQFFSRRSASHNQEEEQG